MSLGIKFTWQHTTNNTINVYLTQESLIDHLIESNGLTDATPVWALFRYRYPIDNIPPSKLDLQISSLYAYYLRLLSMVIRSYTSGYFNHNYSPQPAHCSSVTRSPPRGEPPYQITTWSQEQRDKILQQRRPRTISPSSFACWPLQTSPTHRR